MRDCFGWHLPPGADSKWAPWNQEEKTCGVCGLAEVDCSCVAPVEEFDEWPL